jgi:hypothetical protein
MPDTYAHRRVWLPEEAVVELHTGDLGLALKLIPRVTLERDGVSRLPAVTIAGTILHCPWIIAGGGNRGYKEQTTQVRQLPVWFLPCTVG